MSYSQTATSDPYAFSLWPDTSAASEESMMLAQAAGCTQPLTGLTVDDLFFDDLLGTTLTRRQSGTVETFGFLSNSDINWMAGGAVTTVMPSHGVPLPTAMNTSMTLAPPTTALPLTDNMGAYAQGFFVTQPDFSTSWSKALADIASLPSPQSDGTGNGFPFPTFGSTSSCFIFGAIGLHNTPRPACNAHRSVDHAGHAATIILLVDDKNSGKNEVGTPKKRGRPSAMRVPGGAESAKRTRKSPATKTQTNVNNKSKVAVRGAEMLASMATQGVYHRSLSGLSVPQESMGALLQEQPSWIEEREQVETRHDSGRSVPFRGVENAEDGEVLCKIPTNLTERERLMLQMTPADEERGAVRAIMCRVCSNRCFRKWATFQRHCKSCEKHPSELQFCPKCGDYFGRQDSETRHKDKKHQGACLSTSEDEAREKEQKARRILKAFEVRLQHCLRSGEDPGPRFSEVMSRKLTNTSKKVSKAETSLEGGSWATGLC